MASFMNNSQTCTTQSRILAPRSRYDEVVDALATYTRNLSVGNPLDPSVEIGPMASETHLQLGSPFGGMKDSGLGRELGPEALTATSSTSRSTAART